MSPAVSILIPTDAAPEFRLEAVLANLRTQSIDDWEAIFVGPDLLSSRMARNDRRTRILPARSDRAELLNLAIDSARAPFVLILDPADALEPGALGALLNTQASTRASAVVGNFQFVSRLGPLPGDPLAGVPDTIGWDDLLHADLFPTHALLIDKCTLGFLRTGMDDAWAYDHWLRLTESGLRMVRTTRIVASFNLRELSTPFATLDALTARIRIVKASLERKGQTHRIAEVARDLCDAFIALRAHQQTIDRDGDQHLTTTTRFPFLFPQWWQRLGFHGRPPRHVLEANGGVGEGISGSPELVSARLIDLCPPGEAPILLGLGKNARHIARRLHARNIPVRGRDDSLSAAPAWSIEDGIPVELIPREAEYDAEATYIMTVLNDAAFLSRLRKNLTIHRWAKMPELILSEWQTLILDPSGRSPPNIKPIPRLEIAPA